ncbi:MAG: hypothetical protein ACYTFG_08505 [Planctomycetota bacterium]|jgi:hypothetical protein
MRALTCLSTAFLTLSLTALSCNERSHPEPLDLTQPAAEAMEGLEEEKPKVHGEAELRKAVKAMEKELGEGFVVKGRFPFAVGTDLPERKLERSMDGTVFSSYKAFYHQFFTARPTRVIKVYLFDGGISYRKNAWRLWRDKPSTPFGYYMPSREAMIMNIATGGGTLIHEMVHALMAYDFPKAPKWFDEGMGSLFEGCQFRDKGIYGMVNWRLPILKRGLAEGRNLTLRALMRTTWQEFLDEESSLHYAQARYFCMYMQEKDLLETYYRLFRDGYEKDPMGIDTAEKVFGKSLEEVEAECLAWVKTLRR